MIIYKEEITTVEIMIYAEAYVIVNAVFDIGDGWRTCYQSMSEISSWL
jgi:hypothetical protein